MSLEDVLVAVSRLDDGEPVGAGFLVDHRLLLTCAHVVNQALGRHDEEVSARPSEHERVSVRFQTIGSPLLSAHVASGDDAWNPPPARRELGADTCLLWLVDDPPVAIGPSDLGISSNLSGRHFRTAGFPKDWDLDAASGQVVARDEGFYMLRPDPGSLATISTRPKSGWRSDQTRPPGIIAEGFSGAPVEIDRVIVGMLVEARQLIAEATAYMLPVSAFPKRLARLAQRLSDDHAISIRPATPNSPRVSLVKAYLRSISVDTNEFEIKRSVLRQIDLASSPSPSAPARPPAPEPLETALEREGKLILLGEPGLGKSTALSSLEKMVASRTLSGASSSLRPWIPILVELKMYNGEPELETLLAARVNSVLRKEQQSLSADPDESTRIMKTWLNDANYGFVILLDALDEVPSPFEERAHNHLKSLLNYRHRFVLTCRIADYAQSLDQVVSPFVLVKLQPQEIQHYLEDALGASGTSFFQKQLQPDKAMLALASNALLLKLMVEIIGQTPGVSLPNNRGRLFSQFIDAMVRRRRREVFKLDVSHDLIQGALAKLGVEILDRRGERPPLGEVRQWDIPCGSYDLDLVLREAKKSRFLSSDGSQNTPIEFIHPLFIEYFAAVYLNETLKGSPPDYGSALNKRIGHPRWREAIIMLAGISARPADLLSWIANRLKFEAALGSLFGRLDLPAWTLFFGWYQTKVDLLLRCWEGSSLSEDQRVHNEIVEALQWLVHCSTLHMKAGTRSAWLETASALRALAKLGDDRVLPDIERLIDQQATGRTSGFSLWNLSTFFQPDIPELAREAADEIRRRTSK